MTSPPHPWFILTYILVWTDCVRSSVGKLVSRFFTLMFMDRKSMSNLKYWFSMNLCLKWFWCILLNIHFINNTSYLSNMEYWISMIFCLKCSWCDLLHIHFFYNTSFLYPLYLYWSLKNQIILDCILVISLYLINVILIILIIIAFFLQSWTFFKIWLL